MTLSELASLGEAIGGIAVLVTLGYLAYQFRQTASIERTAGQRELLSRCRDWIELGTIHPDLFEALRQAMNDWDAATPQQKERANGWMLSAALQAEQAMYMWQERLINEPSYRGFVGVVVAIATTPGGARWWQQAREPLGDDIVDLVDGELAARPADAKNWIEMFPHFGLDAEAAAGDLR